MIVISNVKDVQVDLFDEVWFITNTNPQMPIGAQHHPEIAPNKNSFISYKRGDMSLKSLLDGYSLDLHNNVYKDALDSLIKKSNNDLWLQLVCYCDVLENCHRYRLYEYLKEIKAGYVELI